MKLLDLASSDSRVVDFEHLNGRIVGWCVFVDADYRLRTGIDARLRFRGGFFDVQLGNARFDRLSHPAKRLDLFNVAPGFPREFVGQALNVIRAAPRVDDTGCARFLLQNDLRIARDPGGKIGWQGKSFVKRIGMKRLGLTLRRRHCLDRRAGDIVEHVLRRQRPARGLTVRAQ